MCDMVATDGRGYATTRKRRTVERIPQSRVRGFAAGLVPVCPPIPPTGSSGIKSLGATILPMVAPLIVDQDEMK